MALRVLLADESNTIKRVIELSLQDYAVEVQPVFIGTDVLQVAKSYRPDIIFVDILLQKLSGYEVSRQLKDDPQMAQVPVVLIWSGFMDFDEQKYKASGADAKLEKPFNSDNLRAIVQQLVPKTRSQVLSQFITLPEFIDETPHQPTPTATKKPLTIDNVEALEIETTPEQPNLAPTPQQAAQKKKWNMDSFESIESFAQSLSQPSSRTSEDDELAVEEFSQVRLGKKPMASPPPPTNEITADAWVQKDLSRFRAPEPIDEEKTLLESLNQPPKKPQEDTFDFSQTIKKQKSKKLVLEDLPQATATVSEEKAEKMLSQQAREILEQVAWKVVPELAEKIIREELERLLKDKDAELHID